MRAYLISKYGTDVIAWAAAHEIHKIAAVLSSQEGSMGCTAHLPFRIGGFTGPRNFQARPQGFATIATFEDGFAETLMLGGS